MDMRVCVAIPSYRRPEPLRTLLEQLGRQSGSRPFEVFVLNDGGDQDSQMVLLSSRPSRFFLRHHSTPAPSGLPSARNRLLDYIAETLDEQPTVVVFLDDDCEVNTEFVHEVARMAGNADAFAFRIETVGVSGILNTMQNRWLSVLLRPLLGRAFLRCGIVRAGYFVKTRVPVTVDHLPGGCLAYRFDRYRELRFDERLNEGNAIMEDTDFSCALKRAGAVLWYDGSYGIVHRPPAAGGVRLLIPAQKFYYYWKHKAFLTRKWAGRWWFALSGIFGFFEALLVSALQRRWLVPQFLRGMSDALRGRYSATAIDDGLTVCSVQSGLDPHSARGGEVYDVGILRALSKHIRVSVLIPNGKPFADFGYLFSVRLMCPLGAAWRYYADIFFSLRAHYHQHPGALLRVHSPYKMALPVWLFARLHGGVRCFAQYHHVEDDRISRMLTRIFAPLWDGICVPSRFTRDELIAHYGARPERIMVARPGADGRGVLETLALATVSKSAPLTFAAGADDFIILTIGSLIARKNVSFLLEVMARLPERVKLLVAGDGPLRGPLERQALLLGCAGRVYFAGRVDETRKHELLASADLFALPSIKEGYGISVMEAFHCGVPALVSDRGSLPEIVVHEKTGLVLPLESRLWEDAVAHLLDNPALCAAFGEAARVAAGVQECWDEVAARVQKQMESVMRAETL